MQGALRWAFAGLVVALAACGTVLAVGEPSDAGADGGAADGSAADGGAGEGGPDIDGGCPNGTTKCDGTCVDTSKSAEHCGSCNIKCNRGPCLDGGGCERTVFVTNAIFSGDMGGLAGADTACNQAAGAVSLPGKYMAWLASEDAGPADRFTKNAAGYALVDGGLIATSWADLTDGQLLLPIGVTEDGGFSDMAVWSNVATNGTRRAVGQSCASWTSNAGPPIIGGSGLSGDADGGWTAFAQPGCTTELRIYCFEQ